MPSGGPRPSDADIVQAKERTRRVWSLGDYSEIGRLTGQAAQPLVDACAISAGQDVLDVAAGTGNVAIAAAREGARVVASDITPAMIEHGRERARGEGVEIEWVEADAEELPFADASFDCVTSAFGVILAPRPDVVADEVFRVLRPGGTLGMTAWTPDSLIPSQTALIARELPPPPGIAVPSQWGDPEIVRDRLATLAGSIAIESRTARWGAASIDEYVATQEATVGPLIAAREALGPERFGSVAAELRALVREHAEGEGPISIGFDYLLIVARKRG